MSQALYRKWRSQTFSEVVGQEPITRTLRNALRDGRIAHAYLFTGPRGTGKTSTARILAKALNCTAPETERPCNECPTCVAINEGRMIDLIEIDAASNNSVDDVRELRERVGFQPSEGRFKVYIIDEVHMLSAAAFNALLKTLEEPPPHARFILATTEPNRIPATIISRCQRFDFRRIPVMEIVDHLTFIVTEEGFRASKEALLVIARSAQGCMRDAISLLDQMLSFGAQDVTLDQVQQILGVVNIQAVGQLVDAMAARDIASGLKLIQQLVLDGSSLVEYVGQVVEHLRNIMVVQMTGDAGLLTDLPEDVVQMVEGQAKSLTPGQTLYAIKRLGGGLADLKGSHQPQLLLELAFVEIVQGEVPPVAASVAVPAPTPVVAPTAALPRSQSTPGGTGADRPAPSPSGGAEKVQSEGTGNTLSPDLKAQELLRQRWKEFLNLVREQGGYQVQAALNTVRDVAIADRTVVFAFGSNAFTRDMVAKSENLRSVADILARILGHPVKLECQMGETAQLSGLAGGGEAGPQDGPDPLVDFAVKDLGAKIVAPVED